MPRYLKGSNTRFPRAARAGLCLLVGLFALSLSGCAVERGLKEEVERGLYPAGAAFAPEPHFKMKWRRGVNAPEIWDFQPREFSGPLYREETDELFVGTDSGELIKVRGGDGKVLWRVDLGSPVHTQVAYGAGRVFVGTLGGDFVALDEGNGEVDWQVSVDGSLESRAVFSGGRIFFSSGQDVLMALDATTGKRLWDYRRALPEYFTMKGSGEPVVEDGVVYCGFADGVLAALQEDSGEVIWQADLSGGKTEFTDVDTQPIIAGGRIYAASYDGGVYALERSSGDPLWHRPISGVADLVYGEGKLYLATARGRIITLDAEDGEPGGWSFKFKDDSPVAIAATDLYLFVSTASGPLYALDRLSGVALTRWSPSHGFNAPVALGPSRGYTLSNGGYLYGFDIAF